MLSNKRAVVTGSSDGIGLAIARAFSRAGASVLLVARDEQKLNAAAESISAEGPEVRTVPGDLGSLDSVREIASRILGLWPQIDVLVNNAGIARFTPFASTSEEELEAHLALNVKAPYVLAQRLFPALAARQGAIINISSYFSHRMLPGRPSTAYSLTKGAIDAFTKALAFEAGPAGVRVNAIAPGTVDTPLVRSNLERLTEEGRAKFADMIRTIYPLGRIGAPEDIAGAAVFLASEAARWVTGAILAVDGGLTTN